MKVLYIGYYKEHSDWGIHARNNILALEKAGVDVACRAITFGETVTPPTVKHLEEKEIEDCDICIQHVFPEHMVASSKFKKNIGVFENEFNTIEHSTWVEILDQLDEIWVPSDIARELMPEILKKKTRLLPHCSDKDDYSKKQPQIETKEALGNFKFYTIFDSSMQNLECLLKCFHSEFDKEEKVSLIIQIGNSETPESLSKTISTIKTNINKNKKSEDYIKDIVVPQVEDPSTLNQLHEYGDCFVSSSNQRCLTSDIFNAMCFGSTPIVLDKTDAAEYVDPETVVNSVYKIMQDGESDRWKDVYNQKNYYLTPCEKHTKEIMRNLYNQWLNDPLISIQKRKLGLRKADKFSLQSVGNVAKGMLSE